MLHVIVHGLVRLKVPNNTLLTLYVHMCHTVGRDKGRRVGGVQTYPWSSSAPSWIPHARGPPVTGWMSLQLDHLDEVIFNQE